MRKPLLFLLHCNPPTDTQISFAAATDEPADIPILCRGELSPANVQFKPFVTATNRNAVLFFRHGGTALRTKISFCLTRLYRSFGASNPQSQHSTLIAPPSFSANAAPRGISTLSFFGITLIDKASVLMISPSMQTFWGSLNLKSTRFAR